MFLTCDMGTSIKVGGEHLDFEIINIVENWVAYKWRHTSSLFIEPDLLCDYCDCGFF